MTTQFMRSSLQLNQRRKPTLSFKAWIFLQSLFKIIFYVRLFETFRVNVGLSERVKGEKADFALPGFLGFSLYSQDSLCTPWTPMGSQDSHGTPGIFMVLPGFQGFPTDCHGFGILGIRLFPLARDGGPVRVSNCCRAPGNVVGAWKGPKPQ